MGEKMELKFRCVDEDQLNRIANDLQNFFRIPELRSAHYEDVYFLSNGEKDCRWRRNVERNTSRTTRKTGQTIVDEDSGILLRHEQEVDIPVERLGAADEHNSLRIDKFRRYFTVDESIVFGFDVVQELGCFVEIESDRSDAATLLKLAKLLNKYELAPERLSYCTQLLKRRMGDEEYYAAHPEFRP
jgi:adenylate cyclase class IV